MEELNNLKNSAVTLMDKKDYRGAIQKFEKVISSIQDPTNDDDIILKVASLLDCSSCYTKQKTENDENLVKAQQHAEEALSILLKARPPEWRMGKTSEVIRKDSLIVLTALAYVQLGKLDDVNNKFMDALLKFRTATLYNKDKGEDAIYDLMKDLGVVKYEEEDPDFEPFSHILFTMRDISSASSAASEVDPSQISDGAESSLNAEITKIRKGADDILSLFSSEQPKPIIEKINKSLCFHTLFAAMRIYNKDREFIVKSYKACTAAVKQGITSVWDGLVVISETLQADCVDTSVIEAAMELFKTSPKGIFEPMALQHLLSFVLPSILFPDLSDESYDTACYVGFMILDSNENEVASVDNPIFVEQCLKRRTEYSLKLLSKLVLYIPHAQEACEQNAMDYICEILEGQTKPDYIIPAIIVAVRIFLLQDKWPLEVPEDSEDYKKLSSIASRFTNAILPVISAQKDIVPVVSFGFAALSLIVFYARQAIVEKKAFLAASVMLSKYINHSAVVPNIITFLYECAAKNLINEIKKIPIVTTTVLKALQTHSKTQNVVERAVGYLLLMEHPSSIQLLQAGIVMFPDSSFLLRLLHQHKTK